MTEEVNGELEEIPVQLEENGDDYSDDDLFNIISWGADLSFRELITMYEEDELLKPEIQRNYVWDKNEASRFIETILMGLPVPSIFLAKSGEDNLIVDGYQRIMTVYDFVKRGLFSKDNSVFKLSNTKSINERWRGKSYGQLTPEEKKRIRNSTIHAIIFDTKQTVKNDTSLYQVFERINTGGRQLLPQEIRNCIYHNDLNSLLIKLNKNEDWRNMFGDSSPDSRMRDIEYILRYITLGSPSVKNDDGQQIILKKSLNIYMGESTNSSKENLTKIDNEFKTVVNFLYNSLGKTAFSNFKDGKPTKFHPAIFDSIMVATTYVLSKGIELEQFKKTLAAKKMELIENEEFKEYISERTTRIDHINGRINLATGILYGISYA
ncbi:MAG: DUF262 domain-containing protein [Planococcus donghaensis]